MKKQLRIAGLGRCVIGHIRKLLQEDYREACSKSRIIFDHHYILNLETCLHPSYSADELAYLFKAECMPLLSDQLQCLENIPHYEVCAIELFPPSPIYQHISLNISACFESFTSQLSDLGFCKNSLNDGGDVRNIERHYSNILKLISKIKLLNKDIKIILINGELTKQDGEHQVGSIYLHKLINKIKQSDILLNDDIKLLDMNDLLCSLQGKGTFFFETAFPYIYIRHNQDLHPIGLARDCKHTTPVVRRHFNKHFYTKLREWGFCLPDIQINNHLTPKKHHSIHSSSSLTKRANIFLNKHAKDANTISALLEAKHLSLFASYAIAEKNITAYGILQKFIINFSGRYPYSALDLKNYFYHFRTIAAFSYQTTININSSLYQIGTRILELPEYEIKQYDNFALLWLKDIYMIISHLPVNESQRDYDCLINFMKKLSKNSFLKNHTIVQTMIIGLNQKFCTIESTPLQQTINE